MNLKAFFVATLGSALDLGIAVPDDVVRHVTPEVLSIHLPRPLWARLLTACVGAPRVDAQLVVETIGVANLCEHIPLHIIWACVAELGQRSLGGVVIAPPRSDARGDAAVAATSSRPVPLATPPPPPAADPKPSEPRPVALGPSIPAPLPEAEGETPRRVPPGQRFRPSSTGAGRLATNSGVRRPQAQATPPSPPPAPSAEAAPRARRGQTESDYDLETFVGGKDDWKTALAVEDEQLVDWSASDDPTTAGDELNRKR